MADVLPVDEKRPAVESRGRMESLDIVDGDTPAVDESGEMYNISEAIEAVGFGPYQVTAVACTTTARDSNV